MRTGSGGDLVEQLHADLDDLLALDDETLRAGLLSLVTAGNRLQAAVAAWVGSFDARGLSDADACRTTTAWLHSYLRLSGRAASGVVKRGRLLRDLPAVAQAAAQGDVNVEHLDRIGALVKQVGVDPVKPADHILADAAAQVDPAELGLVCDRIRDYIQPDGPEPAELFDKRDLTLADVGGMVAIRGQLDPEGGAAVREALDALMKPPAPDDHRTTGQRRADALADLARGALAHGHLPTVGGMRPQVGILITPQTLLHDADTPPDHGTGPRTRTNVRFGDEPDPPDITHLFDDDDLATEDPADDHDHGDHDDDGGGHAREKHDGVDHDVPADHPANPHGEPPPNSRGDPVAGLDLRSPAERAWLNWYGPIPPALAKRIACDADIWRVVLDPTTGLPLDVGRAHRLVPHWIRRALHARDRGCRWPGCRVPAPWTDGHHLTPWHHGGHTRVEDLLLLCRHHHATVHEGRWRIHLDPTSGKVSVTRPDGTPHDLAPSRPWTTPTTRPDTS
jgi:hypothetical protein